VISSEYTLSEYVRNVPRQNLKTIQEYLHNAHRRNLKSVCHYNKDLVIGLIHTAGRAEPNRTWPDRAEPSRGSDYSHCKL